MEKSFSQATSRPMLFPLVTPMSTMSATDFAKLKQQRPAGMLLIVTTGISSKEVVKFTGNWESHSFNRFVNDISMQVEDVTGRKRKLAATSLRSPAVPLLAAVVYRSERAYAQVKKELNA